MDDLVIGKLLNNIYILGPAPGILVIIALSSNECLDEAAHTRWSFRSQV